MATRTALLKGIFLATALFAGAAATSACSPKERTFGSPASGTGGSGMVCVPGTSAACYEGAEGTEDVGACRAGAMVCAEDGSGYGACEGQVLPATEVCSTPEDDDCDGAALLCPLTHLASQGYVFMGGVDVFTTSMATDPQGNAVVFMSFSGTLPLGKESVTSIGSGSDLLVLKLDPLGNVLWTRALGGDTDQNAASVAVDASGIIYIAGTFSSNVDFGIGKVFMSAGSSDIYLAKLDQDGNVMDAIRAGDSMNQSVARIAVDDMGRLFVTGTNSGVLTFPKGPTLNSGGGSAKIYVAKLDPTLTTIAAVQSSGIGSSSVYDLAIGSQGNPIITGEFSDTVTFGSIVRTSLGADDIFIAKLSGSDLNPLWMHQFGSVQSDRGRAVDIDSKSDIFLTGNFQGFMDVGAVKLMASTEESMFVAKLTPAGEPVWAKAFGGAAQGSHLPLLKVDSKDDLIVGGTFVTKGGEPSPDFGGGPITGAVVTGFGGGDVFLAKLTGDGAHIASKAFGNDELQIAGAIGVVYGDQIMITGGTNGQLNFGGAPIGNLDVKSSALFFATFSP